MRTSKALRPQELGVAVESISNVEAVDADVKLIDVCCRHGKCTVNNRRTKNKWVGHSSSFLRQQGAKTKLRERNQYNHFLMTTLSLQKKAVDSPKVSPKT